jgi:hypothetical protein
MYFALVLIALALAVAFAPYPQPLCNCVDVIEPVPAPRRVARSELVHYQPSEMFARGAQFSSTSQISGRARPIPAARVSLEWPASGLEVNTMS